MKSVKILIPILMLFLLSFVVCGDTSYSFLTATTFNTQTTNNTYVFQGNDNNTYLIFGNVNGTIKEVQLSNLSNIINLTNFNTNCNASAFFSNPASNGGAIYRFNDNSTVCFSGASGTARYYYGNGSASATPTLAANEWLGFTYSGTNVSYEYNNGGNPLVLNKKIMPALTSYPALNCYSQLVTVFSNNFGINLTAKGGLNQSLASGTLIQHNLSLFYFQVDGRWFYFEESNSNDCTVIAQTLNEATLTYPNVTTTNNRYSIINDVLYIVAKDSNTLNLISSQEVDIYSGLVCNDDYSLCYNQTGVCFPNNEFYPGVNSSNYLCTNVSIIGDDLYCYTGTGLIEGGLTYYAGGCINSNLTNLYSVSYTTGTGYNSSTCSNDCDIEGLTYSDTSTSYKQCGFYDSDACLDWSNSIPCSDGEYSLNGFCYTMNTTGYTYYTLTAFEVTPDLSTATSYSYTTDPKEVLYKSPGTSKSVGFDYSASPTTFFIKKNCNYTELTLLESSSETNVNTTYTYNINGYTNGITTLTFTIPENYSLRLRGTDSVNNVIYDYNITNNGSNWYLYDNDSLIGFETVDYTDFKNVQVSVQTKRPGTKQLSSIKVLINKMNGGYQDIYTGFTDPVTDPANNYAKLLLNSNNATIGYIKVFNGEQDLNAWKNTTWTIISNGVIQYQHNCIFTSNNCYTVRSYYGNTVNEGYWNYKDWKVCVNRLTGTGATTGNWDSKFSSRTKILIGLGVSVGIFLLLFILGYAVGLTKIFSFMGMFFSVGFLIYYSIIGWLPAWIIITMFLFSAFVIVMLIRGMVAGQDEM